MDKKELTDLQEELEKSKEVIKKLKRESSVLKKAIWDMLNYANMYVVLLDSNMIIRLINWSLATDLGYKDEREVIGKCWMEFIPKKLSKMVQSAHQSPAHSGRRVAGIREAGSRSSVFSWRSSV